jgi:curved DNA-binding protein CbpA
VVLALLAGGELDVAAATTVPRLRKRVRESTVTLGRKDLPPALAQSVANQSIVPPGAAVAPSRPPTKPPTTTPLASASSSLPPVRPSQTQPVPAVRSPGTQPPSKAPSGTQPPVTPASGPQPAIAHVPDANQAHAIHDKIKAKLAQVDANVDHFVMLEVTRHAGSQEIKNAYLQLAKTYHPDRLALVKLEELRPQVERIFGRLSDAFAAIGEDARRREYLRVLEEGGEAAVKRREDDEVAHATRVLTAEEHFRKGEMALRRQMWPTALQEFQAALELNDAEPEHHALYAWARWCAAEDKEAVFNEVKKIMLRAIELSDRCVPAFLHLGQIYSARGDHDRAYNMFQRVLGVNEHHVEANRQVRLIEMRRSKGEKKGGLFDMFKKK